MCTRGSDRALLRGPSTSPLDVFLQRMRSRLALVLLLACLGARVSANETHWYVINDTDGGCESLTWLHKAFPFSSGSETPPRIFDAFTKQWPDTRLVPLLYYQATLREHGTPVWTPEDMRTLKVTRSNAFVLSSQERHVEVVLLREDVCVAIRNERGQ